MPSSATGPSMIGKGFTFEEKPASAPMKTVYGTYKRATQRYLDFLVRETPILDSIGDSSTNDLMDAAEWIFDNKGEIPRAVIKDLEKAIAFR